MNRERKPFGNLRTEKTIAVAPRNGNQTARITGKEISDRTGWYELYIEKEVSSMSGIYTLTFAMDLKALYEKIVAPVKIGEAGYSTVKDQNMNIIMHHAKNQIGLEAVEGRIQKYPDLDHEQSESLDLQTGKRRFRNRCDRHLCMG
ncbi:MAG: hypothetical protein V8S37_11840 [Lachnospiraceae bacterium]